MPHNSYNIIAFGDSAFLVKFDSTSFSETVVNHIHALIYTLQAQTYWDEVVPGYNSLLAYFCPIKFTPKKAKAALSKALESSAEVENISDNIVEIPVCYGGEYGPDMDIITESSGLSEAEIIKTHSAPLYKVCMMGFVPGFTFLSEAPELLHHNRRSTPRAIVPAGSVGIAGWQTGIYGLESPGGWQLIGRTPLAIFDSLRAPPFILNAGDSVKFVAISTHEFREMASD